MQMRTELSGLQKQQQDWEYNAVCTVTDSLFFVCENLKIYRQYSMLCPCVLKNKDQDTDLLTVLLFNQINSFTRYKNRLNHF
jgi:hypothetical protein